MSREDVAAFVQDCGSVAQHVAWSSSRLFALLS